MGLVLLGWLASCSNGSPSSSTGLKGGSTNSGSSGGSGGGTTSGTATTSGGGGGDDSGSDDSGGGDAQCNNTDLTIISIDPTGWVPRNCDDYQIQGAWYCFDDGIGTDSCMTGVTPYVSTTPGPGMCLSGTTASTTTNTAAYGASIGFSLNDSGGTNSVKSAYSATANGIIGFTFTIAGSTGGLPIHVGFTGEASGSDPAPFFSVPGAGTYTVLFSQANIPTTWAVPNAGATVNPAAIYDIQFEIAAGATAEPYDYCVTNLKPVLAADAGGSSSGGGCGSLVAWGSAECGAPGDLTITDMPNYGVQNDFYGGSGMQCISPVQSGDCAGFTLMPDSSVSSGNSSPASYPSLIYGWHYGTFHGGYKTAEQLSTITSVPTAWNFTPGSGKWDASYDIWLNATGGNPATPAGGMEMMVWANYSGAQPFGSQQGSATIAGIDWAIWEGNMSGWTYVAYVAPQNSTNNSVNLDLKDFFNDTIQNHAGWGLTNSWYLLSVENGFELWNATSTFKSNTYTVSIN
jgi:hypothetical protein